MTKQHIEIQDDFEHAILFAADEYASAKQHQGSECDAEDEYTLAYIDAIRRAATTYLRKCRENGREPDAFRL